MGTRWIGILWFFLPLAGWTQRQCGTVGYMQQVRAIDPLVETRQRSISEFTRAYLLHPPVFENGAIPGGPEPIIVIPVVVHIIYNRPEENISDEQVISQLVALNQDFNKTNPDSLKVPAVFAQRASGCGIRFELARVDPEGRATTGIDRHRTSKTMFMDDDKVKYPATGGVSAWDSRYYMNIWVCNLFGGLLGYAAMPGGPPEKDGVVINWYNFGTRGILHPEFNKGRTLTHETGHWLNLIHLWGDTFCGDDEVDDTPRQRTYNTGCPSFPLNRPGCDNGPDGDMFMNFMDFVDDDCMQLFTEGQKERMRSLFANGGVRQDMLYSMALGQPWNLSPPPLANNDLVPGSVRIFPNPVDGNTIVMETSGYPDLNGLNYGIYSVTGVLVQKGILPKAGSPLALQNLKAGIYFIRIEGLEESIRLVKQ